MTYHAVTLTIEKSTLPHKTIFSASEDMQNLKKGDVVEIKFEDEGYKGDYEVIDKDEKWDLATNGDDTYWYNYTVRAIPHSFKQI